MAIKDWNTHFANLYLNFLLTAPAESGVPGLIALPKRGKNSTAKRTRPFITVTCEAGDKDPHPKLYACTVKVILGIKVSKEGEEPEEAAAWLASIETWLREDVEASQTAFQAYIQSLPIEDRTGWQFLHRSIGRLEEENDEAEHTRDYTLPISVRAVVSR